MALFLLIPLVLLVLTIALAPVLAVAVVPDRRQIRRSTRNDPHAPSSTNSPEPRAARQMS